MMTVKKYIVYVSFHEEMRCNIAAFLQDKIPAKWAFMSPIEFSFLFDTSTTELKIKTISSIDESTAMEMLTEISANLPHAVIIAEFRGAEQEDLWKVKFKDGKYEGQTTPVWADSYTDWKNLI